MNSDHPILMRIKDGWLERWKASVGDYYKNLPVRNYVPLDGFADGKIVELLEDFGDGYCRVRSIEPPYNIGESLWADYLERIDNP